MTARIFPSSVLLTLALCSCGVKESIYSTPEVTTESTRQSEELAVDDLPAGQLTLVSEPEEASDLSQDPVSSTLDAAPLDSVENGQIGSTQRTQRTEIDFEDVEVYEDYDAAPVVESSPLYLAPEAPGAVSGLAGRALSSGDSNASSYGTGSGTFDRSAPSSRVRRQMRRERTVERTPQPDPVSNTEQYTHYGFNDMTQTTADLLSTFAIDVDTASYAIARRKLESGQLPATAAVRVEEFINALPYSYGTPTDEAPFAVHMEAAPHPFQEGHHVLRVGIKGMDIDASERRPVHLTFLVDTSGSMQSSDKMGMVKQSLHYLITQLQDGDTVALATYAGSVQRILGPTPIERDSRIHRAIDNLTASGSTAMNSGIQLAYDMAWDSFERGEENRVIVLSDGDANVGPSSHTEILRVIRDYANRGITLSTIGFGMGNYQDTMMEQLANQGDGNYYYIDRYQEAQKVFGERLGGTLQTIARDVKIQVEFNPEVVQSYRLIGYENRDIADRDFRNDRVDAGEIGAGHTVTALYEVVLGDKDDGQLATVRLRNKVPGADRPAVEWSTTFSSNLLRKRFSQASDNFKMAFCAGTFAELLRNSPYAAEIDYADLADLLESSIRPRVDEDTELLGLVQIADRLSGGRGSVAHDW